MDISHVHLVAPHCPEGVLPMPFPYSRDVFILSNRFFFRQIL